MNDIFLSCNWSGVTLLNILVLDNSDSTGMTYHATVPDNYYQIGLKHKGKTDVHYNGRYLKYYDNTVMYLPKETSERIDYTRYIAEGGYGACIIFDSFYPLPPEPFILSCAGNPAVPQCFYKLAQISKNDSMNGRLESMEAFYRLLSMLHETLTSRSAARTMRERLAPVISYIEANFTQQYIDLSLLADIAGMSPDYFRHCFCEVYGISVLKYINSLRLEKAKSILSNGCSVSEAAACAGFSDANYFTRLFRKKVGVPPSSFRSSSDNAKFTF